MAATDQARIGRQSTFFSHLREMIRDGGSRIQPGQQRTSAPATNVGGSERAVSLAAGAVLAMLGVRRRDLAGLAIAGVGAGMVWRGATGHCSAYHALGMNTADPSQRLDKSAERGLHVVQTFSIAKSPEELYGFWRNFENLPKIMPHLKSVRVIDDCRSHWVAQAPRIAGGQIEWDAEITQDERDSRLTWRSLPGASVDHRGSVRFSTAPGNRGTEVQIVMDYLPPAGRVGKWLAKLLGEAPDQEIREGLRRFKQLMETGEVATVEGQPRGTCTGRS